MKNVPAEGCRTPEKDVEHDNSSEDEDMSPEQKGINCLTIIPFDLILFMKSSNVGMQFFLAIQKQFKEKRKHHYNEYSKVKLARELIEKEMAELEDDDNNAGVNKQAIL